MGGTQTGHAAADHGDHGDVVAHGVATGRGPGRTAQVVDDQLGERPDERRRVVQGVTAQEGHVARHGDLAQLDVEVVERLDVVGDEPERHDQQLLPAGRGELAHGGGGLGLEPLAAAPPLALEGQPPGRRADRAGTSRAAVCNSWST